MNGCTLAVFMDMPFVRSGEEMDYEQKLSEIIIFLCGEELVPTGPSISLWYGSDNISESWYASNQKN